MSEKNTGCNFDLCNEKFSNIDKKMVELKGRVDNFDSIREVLIELKILTSQQLEANVQRDIMIQEQSIVSAKTVGAIEQLSEKLDKTDGAVEDLNKKLIEKENKGVIHLSDIAKGAIMMLLGAVGTAIIAGILK